jgi:hypothetical protein
MPTLFFYELKRNSPPLRILLFAATLLGCITILHSPTLSQSSVLQSGKWYKVAVSKDGVYKINFDALKKMGFEPSKIDPRNIKIYGNKGGMLPQANAMPRPVDLTENAILVHGESDGKFNSGDYILFFAKGADSYYYDQQRQIVGYQKNLYADKNFYFITVDETAGKRITTSPNLAGDFPIVNQFENFVHYELEQHNELKSGRDWYGERFDLTTTLTKSFSLPNIVAGSTVKLVSDVMAQSFGGSSFSVSINGVPVITQSIVAIPNTQYGIKGRDLRDTIIIDATTIGATARSNQEIKYQYTKSPSGYSVGYLDYFLLQVTQSLGLYGQQTIFRSPISMQQPTSTFQIAQATSQSIVWDITNPYEPQLQTTTLNGNTTSFSTATTSLKEFIIFNSNAPSPELVGAVANQNIRGAATPTLIIVTHPQFKTEAYRLANHRSNINGLSVLVITTDQVYNEFSSGRQDVTAIRDMAKYFYDKSTGTLKSLLLFGKGSYDYKYRIVDNKNFVPMYESRNSLHPLLTYSSDDYLGFLENNEGDWGEDPVINHTLDIGVGRIPVKTTAEAKSVVDKLIRYDSDPALRGNWRKEMVFVADDGDFNLHQSDADELAEFVETNHPQFDVKKIYLDKYPQISRPSGVTSPETSKAIENAFYNGALVLNYTGHGGERLWAQEKIFDDLLIQTLENERLPLLVTATCEFGRQDDPVFISGAELCLLHAQGGSIGLVTTARPVSAATNFLLNKAFYNALFQKENNQYLSLGEIFRRTKNTSLSGVSNRNFSLIGDPSMRLAMPQYNIDVTEVTTSGSSILKAMSTVTVKGSVATLAEFNGIVEAVLFDKETSFITLGNENQPFQYSQWYNAIFRGKATTDNNGQFEFQFIVPKNIAYSIDVGKLSVYAYDDARKIEATGFSKDFTIGGSEPDAPLDTTPPVVELFIGDASFKNGGITTPNTQLFARLTDASGINISSYGIGNSLEAILDGTESFILNDFYQANANDFTKGTIQFPLRNLKPGKHILTLKAWDTFNNPAQTTIAFVVTDSEAISIDTFGNYPNPFTGTTKLFFTHNRMGDNLRATLTLYDYSGQVLSTKEFDVLDSKYEVDLVELSREIDFGKNQSGGLYLARLIVRSLSNGSKSERVTKLILSN